MKIQELDMVCENFIVLENNKFSGLIEYDSNLKIGDIILIREYKLLNNVISYTGNKLLRKISDIILGTNNVSNKYFKLSLIEHDIELNWKDNVTPWGEIFCPMVGKYLMTYSPDGISYFNTVSNPFLSEDGDIYYYEFDHDESCWIEENGFTLVYSDDYINLNEVVICK